MYGRRRLIVRGAVYRGAVTVAEMCLEGWILHDDRVVGTARTVPLAPYPFAYPVPKNLVARTRAEPMLRLDMSEGTIAFHIGSQRGVLVNARIIRR